MCFWYADVKMIQASHNPEIIQRCPSSLRVSTSVEELSVGPAVTTFEANGFQH